MIYATKELPRVWRSQVGLKDEMVLKEAGLDNMFLKCGSKVNEMVLAGFWQTVVLTEQ